MSALNALKFAVNRLTEEEACRVLKDSGVKFRVGTEWVGYDQEGQLVNDRGQKVSAGVNQFTGIDVGGNQRTANGILRGTEMQPTPGAPGSAGYFAPEGVDRGRQLVNRGTGEVVRTVVDPNNPQIRHTVSASPTPEAASHAMAAQPTPIPGSAEPVEVAPDSGGIPAEGTDEAPKA
jgi:hypothetical protein